MVINQQKQIFKLQFKKRCFDFSINIIRLTEKFPNNRKFWIIADQLIRSSTSIGANIIEGSNSSSSKEFINYFQIALKSASETLYWLAILNEINKDKRQETSKFIQECIELKKIISTIILNTKENSKF